MDLTRLYNLTTPELREQAERLGVADTYAMSRGQLIHAIREKAGEPRPEGLLGKVFGFAKWAIQAAGETAAARAESPAESAPASPAESPAESAPASPAESAPVPVPASVPASVPVSKPDSASAPAPASEPPPDDEVDSINAAATALGSEAAIVDPIEPASAAQTGPSSRPPAGVFSSEGALLDEPFPTRTMARILAEQGHFKRALAIYARLLDDEPKNSELVAEARAVREQARSRRSYAPP